MQAHAIFLEIRRKDDILQILCGRQKLWLGNEQVHW